MEYKYSPIVKYIILLISMFMFMKYLHVLDNTQILLISLSILAMVIVFDYVLIEDHPNIINIPENDVANISKKDIQEAIDNYDSKNSDDDEIIE